MAGLLIIMKGMHKKHRDCEAPVVGVSRHEQRPTSGDVHLYADPISIKTQFPKLSADCEGLNGGDNAPQNQLAAARTGTRKLLASFTDNVKSLFWKNPGVGREAIVSTLYSRLLYTVSDVVMFVLVNTR